MLPSVIVVGQRDDAVGALLSRGGPRPFTVEFCAERECLAARVGGGAQPPAALVVELRDARGVPAAALVRHVKLHWPALVAVVFCPSDAVRGTDVLDAARAGAEHFVFSAVDDLGQVLAQIAGFDARCPIRSPVPQRARGDRRGRGRFAAAPDVLPPVVPAPLRRLIVSCLGPTPIATIADLAQAMGVSGRTLHRLITRRAWPSAAELLLWGRLFRGAVAAGDARALGGLASPAQIAAAAGYHRTDSAARAYRRRAGVGMHAVRLDGPAAVTPAFLRAIAGTPAGAAA